MRNNIIFSFDPKSYDFGTEAEGENCVLIIKHFLGSVLSIPYANDVYIPVAHRLGIRRTGTSRQIIATFPVADELHMVLRHSNRLRETKHYINRQVPAEIRERNQYALPEFKQKRQNPANKAHLANGKLYVKGRLQSKFLTPTLPRVDSADENIPNFTIAIGDKITDGGSTFTGYAADVTNLEDVSVVLEQSLKLDGIAAATHRIYAYRYKGSGGGINENFDSDGDDGVGLQLLKAMRDDKILNRIWIVTRLYGPDYHHIGKARLNTRGKHVVTPI